MCSALQSSVKLCAARNGYVSGKAEASLGGGGAGAAHIPTGAGKSGVGEAEWKWAEQGGKDRRWLQEDRQIRTGRGGFI